MLFFTRYFSKLHINIPNFDKIKCDENQCDKSNLAELYREKGREKGEKEGIEEIICKQLKIKFSQIPNKYKQNSFRCIWLNTLA